MTSNKFTLSQSDAQSLSDATTQSAALCNELEELMMLHYFFYQTVEQYFNDRKPLYKQGLSLFPAMLRERDIDALDKLQQLQELLRELKHSKVQAT